jgi:hypothetical protein
MVDLKKKLLEKLYDSCARNITQPLNDTSAQIRLINDSCTFIVQLLYISFLNYQLTIGSVGSTKTHMWVL